VLGRVVRLAGDFQAAVEALDTLSDDAHAFCPATRTARTTARYASLIPNPLSLKPCAPSSRTAAAYRANVVERLAGQQPVRSGDAPRLVGHAAKRNAGLAHYSARHVECGRNRHQRKGMAAAVAHLQVARVSGECRRRQ